MISAALASHRRRIAYLAALSLVLLVAMSGSRGAAAPNAVGPIMEFAIPTTGSVPAGIAPGPDGNLWFSEYGGNQIGRITPGGVVTEFALPEDDRHPSGIVTVADSTLYFTEDAPVSRIASISAVGLDGQAFPTPSGGTLGAIAPGNGGTWFAETSANKIANIQGTEVSVPTPASQPTGVTPGPDGNIWFTEMAGNKIGRLMPIQHVITEFPVPTANSAPNQITFGPDGNVWFTETDANKIGRITPKGVITEFPLPTTGSSPRGIVTGPDRNVWFTEYAGGKIGRITPAGVITEYPLPDSHGAPALIAAGSDGSVWFTDDRAGSGEPEQIGRVQVTGPGVFFLVGAIVPRTMSVTQGTTVRWNVYSAFKVSIVDNSGMGLFASGMKGPGAMFMFTFVGAGTYVYYDASGSGLIAAIAVPVQSSPTSGMTSTSFTITWSSAPPPSGYVFDVQVNGPTDADFVDLLTNQTATSTSFTPTEGPGGYFFRARLRKTADNTHSDWSPPVAIAVS